MEQSALIKLCRNSGFRKRDKDMKNEWILDKGSISGKDIIGLVNRYFTDDYYYLAGCTDSFCSGTKDLTSFLEKKNEVLLELRVFTEDKELFLFRSILGHDFSWRITSDDGLDNNDYIDYRHYIDINSDSERTYMSGDRRNIISTVGGEYSLPIKEHENMVRIRAYVSYDRNGIGKIADHRVCGFASEQEA